MHFIHLFHSKNYPRGILRKIFYSRMRYYFQLKPYAKYNLKTYFKGFKLKKLVIEPRKGLTSQRWTKSALPVGEPMDQISFLYQGLTKRYKTVSFSSKRAVFLVKGVPLQVEGKKFSLLGGLWSWLRLSNFYLRSNQTLTIN